MSKDAVTAFVFMCDEPAKVDLTVVLGSPSISNIEPAIAMYHAGLTQKILITGHGPSDDSVPEWRVYRDHAIAQGVAETQILVEREARNTAENFILSNKIIDAEMSWDAISSIAICCKPLHTRRAYMTARQHFPEHVGLLMIPPQNSADIQSFDWWATQSGQMRVLGEVMRIGKYGQKQDLSLD